MSEIVYRLARPTDVGSFTALRVAFLTETAPSGESVQDMAGPINQFFTATIPTGEIVSYIAVSESKVIASSSLVYHNHPPSPANPTGREAYIMNMYTLPIYRRRGIATKLLQMLVEHARENGCGKISLHVLPGGRSIYKNAGFIPIETEMRLNIAK